MSHTLSRFFTQDDLSRITTAVQEAEAKTSGEIVPFVVDHSSTYEEAQWRSAALLSTLALALLVFFHSQEAWGFPFTYGQMSSLVLLAGVVGFALVRWNSFLKRLFAGHHLMERHIGQRAAEAFINEEVFKTRDRTGILIFVSLLEHRVMVLGDTGINAKVKPDDWHSIVRTIVRGIQKGTPAEGLIEGIRESGDLLARHGVSRRPDDQDELPDALRMSDH